MSNVIRVRKEQNFTIIDNGIFKDTKLSMKAKGLLTTMLSLPSDWDFSTLGLTMLSTDGDASVRSAIKELEQNGYLKREAIRESGIITDWKYTIYEVRQNEDFSKKSDKEKPVVGNQRVDKSQQLSTQLSSTKEESSVSTNVDTEIPKEISSDNSKTQPCVLTNTSTKYKPIRRQRVLFDDEEPKKKKSLWEKCVDEIDKRYGGTMVYDSIKEYLDYRIHSKQHSLGFSGWVSILNKLDVLGQTDEEKCKIIEQSIKMKWDTFAELRTWNKKTGCERFGETEDMRSGVPVGEVLDIQF